MTSEKVSSWLRKRPRSKVELPTKYRYQRRSSRIRDRVGAAAKDLNYVPETVTLSEGESDKNADPITSSVATATPQPTPKSPPKSAAKEKKVTPKQKAKKPEKKAQPKRSSKRQPVTSSRVKGTKFSDPKNCCAQDRAYQDKREIIHIISNKNKLMHRILNIIYSLFRFA